MKTKLITALRATATALETMSFHYDWKKRTSCNCGSLFCALTGKSQSELPLPPEPRKTILNQGPTWTESAGFYCPVTGKPNHELFVDLMGYGLLPCDIYNLEYLHDDKVLAKLGVKKLNHTDRLDVIRYMRAWADLLTNEGQDNIAPVPEAMNRKPSLLKRIFGVYANNLQD